MASEGRLTFMTSNYPERLDPALIRPGRVDVKLLVDYCTPQQARKLFQNFFNDVNIEVAEAFVENIFKNKENVSAAELQAFLLLFKDNVDTAVLESQHLTKYL